MRARLSLPSCILAWALTWFTSFSLIVRSCNNCSCSIVFTLFTSWSFRWCASTVLFSWASSFCKDEITKDCSRWKQNKNEQSVEPITITKEGGNQRREVAKQGRYNLFGSIFLFFLSFLFGLLFLFQHESILLLKRLNFLSWFLNKLMSLLFFPLIAEFPFHFSKTTRC